MALPSRGSSLGQIVAYNGYNYKWTGAAWLNIGQASSAIGNTSITGAGVSVGTTSVTSTAVSVGSTSVSNTGLSVGSTSVSKTAVTVGSTTVSNTGVSVGTTSVSKTAVTVGSTTVSNTGVSVGSVSVSTTGVSVGSVAVSTTGVSVGSVAVSTGRVAVGSVTVSNTSVSIGSVSLSSTGVSLGGTSAISATTYTGTANNSIHLGGIHYSLYQLNSAANTAYQTKAIERAALANTNLRITLVNTNLLSTNTSIRSYVDTKVAAVVNSAPGTLDTLRELANALGNNASFATATAALIGTKISVANAAATFQTKTIERAALANTNAFIKAQLANTNSYIATKISGPASSTNNAVVVFDGATGKLSRNSLVTISSTGAIVAPIAGSVIPFHYDNQAAFPSATTYHGAIAHSHADGKMYFAHSGNWNALANNIDVNDRIQVANAAATYLTKSNPVITGTVTANGSTGTAGYYLRTSGAGIYWSPVATSTIATVNATSQIFSGTGSQTNFSLSAAVSQQKNVIITINGLLQIPVTHYTISGSTLSFTSAPYSGAAIEARNLEGVVISGGSGGTISSGDLFIGSMLLGGM